MSKRLIKNTLDKLSADEFKTFQGELLDEDNFDGQKPLTKADLEQIPGQPSRKDRSETTEMIRGQYPDTAVQIIANILQQMKMIAIKNEFLKEAQGVTTSGAGMSASVPAQAGVSDFDSGTEPQDNEYPLTHDPRGRCLIINNEKFVNGKNRTGALEDEKELKGVFTSLGFKVEIHKDLTAQGIRGILKKHGKEDFSMADAMVVCVLSHGKEGCVCGIDGEKVSLKELRKPFRSRSAKSLAGKPKLFFIQACQGSAMQKGLLDDLEVDDDDDDGGDDDDDDDSQPKAVADYADFLMGMSTVEGFKALRNKRTGSLYIQELCRQLIAAAERGGESILDILTDVNRVVGSEVHTVKGDDTIQAAEQKSTLTRKLKLTLI